MPLAPKQGQLKFPTRTFIKTPHKGTVRMAVGGGEGAMGVWGRGGSEMGEPRLGEEREMGRGKGGWWGWGRGPFGNNSRSSAAAVLYPLQS